MRTRSCRDHDGCLSTAPLTLSIKTLLFCPFLLHSLLTHPLHNLTHPARIHFAVRAQSCRDHDGCLFTTPLTLSIKTLLFALTVIAELQLAELIVRRVLNKQMQMCDEHFLNERKKDKTVVWNKTYRAMHTTPAWTVFSIYYNTSDFVAMLIFLPHPSIMIPTTVFDKQLVCGRMGRRIWLCFRSHFVCSRSWACNISCRVACFFGHFCSCGLQNGRRIGCFLVTFPRILGWSGASNAQAYSMR